MAKSNWTHNNNCQKPKNNKMADKMANNEKLAKKSCGEEKNVAKSALAKQNMAKPTNKMAKNKVPNDKWHHPINPQISPVNLQFICLQITRNMSSPFSPDYSSTESENSKMATEPWLEMSPLAKVGFRALSLKEIGIDDFDWDDELMAMDGEFQIPEELSQTLKTAWKKGRLYWEKEVKMAENYARKRRLTEEGGSGKARVKEVVTRNNKEAEMEELKRKLEETEKEVEALRGMEEKKRQRRQDFTRGLSGPYPKYDWAYQNAEMRDVPMEKWDGVQRKRKEEAEGHFNQQQGVRTQFMAHKRRHPPLWDQPKFQRREYSMSPERPPLGTEKEEGKKEEEAKKPSASKWKFPQNQGNEKDGKGEGTSGNGEKEFARYFQEMSKRMKSVEEEAKQEAAAKEADRKAEKKEEQKLTHGIAKLVEEAKLNKKEKKEKEGNKIARSKETAGATAKERNEKAHSTSTVTMESGRHEGPKAIGESGGGRGPAEAIEAEWDGESRLIIAEEATTSQNVEGSGKEKRKEKKKKEWKYELLGILSGLEGQLENLKKKIEEF
jgi:hypothetical protein